MTAPTSTFDDVPVEIEHIEHRVELTGAARGPMLTIDLVGRGVRARLILVGNDHLAVRTALRDYIYDARHDIGAVVLTGMGRIVLEALVSAIASQLGTTAAEIADDLTTPIEQVVEMLTTLAKLGVVTLAGGKLHAKAGHPLVVEAIDVIEAEFARARKPDGTPVNAPPWRWRLAALRNVDGGAS
jgi:hypothetical protein